jgi:hypothetical protein
MPVEPQDFLDPASAACPVVVLPASSTGAHHADPAAPALTQPDPAA